MGFIKFLVGSAVPKTALVFHNIYVKPVCVREDWQRASNSTFLIFWQHYELRKSP